MQIKQSVMELAEPVVSRRSSGQHWAIAMLITLSVRRGSMLSHIPTRLCQAMLLEYRMRVRYPDVQLLAVVLEEQVGQADIKLLESAEFEILLLPRLNLPMSRLSKCLCTLL
jgi:hypothetical protein